MRQWRRYVKRPLLSSHTGSCCSCFYIPVSNISQVNGNWGRLKTTLELHHFVTLLMKRGRISKDSCCSRSTVTRFPRIKRSDQNQELERKENIGWGHVLTELSESLHIETLAAPYLIYPLSILVIGPVIGKKDVNIQCWHSFPHLFI